MKLIYLLSYYLFFYLSTTFYFCTLIIYLVSLVYLSTTNYFIIVNRNEKRNGRICIEKPNAVSCSAQEIVRLF